MRSTATHNLARTSRDVPEREILSKTCAEEGTEHFQLHSMTMAAPEEPHDDVGASSPTTLTPTSTPIDINRPNKIPVDRDWLQKLLKRHPNKVVGVGNSSDSSDPIKILAVAPMVDQSDLPFRLQCRKYGSNLCFTPMVHAKLFTQSPEYRKKFQLENIPPEDRPLIAQVCGGDPETVLQAALLLEPYCDGIDINCGCPQQIAKRGKYGAFLLEETDDLLELVQLLLAHLSVPLSVKVRLLPAETRDESVEQSLHLYTRLVNAGVHMLSIHGRNRHQKGPTIGQADWPAVKAVVDLLGHRIPILANGSMANAQDCVECLEATGADGVMVSEAILEYPPLFLTPLQLQQQNLPPRLGRAQLAREYLDLCRTYPPNKGGQGSGVKCMRMHLHKYLHADLQEHTSIRTTLVASETYEDLDQIVTHLQVFQKENNHNTETEVLSWYMRHRTLVRNAQGITINTSAERQKSEKKVKKMDLVDDAADCFACLFDE
jgi:tRNA-dihydrouridine synthase 1